MANFVSDWNKKIDKDGRVYCFTTKFTDFSVKEAENGKLSYSESLSEDTAVLNISDTTYEASVYGENASHSTFIIYVNTGATSASHVEQLKVILKIIYPDMSNSSLNKYGSDFLKAYKNYDGGTGFTISIIEEPGKDIALTVKPS